MIQMTRDEWDAYCKAEAAGDLDAQREIIRRAEERSKDCISRRELIDRAKDLRYRSAKEIVEAVEKMGGQK